LAFLKQSIRVVEKFAFKVSKSGRIYGLFVYICQALATGLYILANWTNLASKHLFKYGLSAQPVFTFPKQKIRSKMATKPVVTLCSPNGY